MKSLGLKKAAIATTFVAFAGTTLGTGFAGAQEPSSSAAFGSSSSELVQLSSTLFGSSKPAPEVPGTPEGAGLIEKVEDVEGLKEPLSADQAKEVLNGSFNAKNNDAIGVGFKEDGALGIDDGCNAGGGTYSIEAETGALEVKDLMSTKMACEPAVMADARAFTSILMAKPQVYVIDDSTIALVSQGHAVQFVKDAEPEETK